MLPTPGVVTPSGRSSLPWRSPSWPYVAPFGVFVCLLAVLRFLPVSDLGIQILLIAGVGLVLVAWPAPGLRESARQGAPHWTGSATLGLLVFLIWIGPDLLFPGYRNHWLFNNALVGSATTSLGAAARSSPIVLGLRAMRAVLVVPMAEELFWRAWLMRWLIRPGFESVPLGAYSARAFWLVAILFASEHGPYWEVGLAAGLLYNWWMVRTGSLGHLILAHAITNLCLSAYVLVAGRWEYWL